MQHHTIKSLLFSAWLHSVCHPTGRYRKPLAFFTVLALGAMLLISCGKDNKDHSKLIIGTWDVQTYHFSYVDYYEDTSWIRNEGMYNVSDTCYIGFDAAEFFVDGIMRWHLNEKYQAIYGNEFPDQYLTLRWSINDNILYLERGPDSLGHVTWEYEIKELNDQNLVIELHERVIENLNNYEFTESYALKRREK